MCDSDREDSDEDRTDSLWDELGIPAPQFWDESLAPEVDRGVLLRLVRRELSEAAARRAYDLIRSFKTWNDAYIEVSIEQYRRAGPSP